MWALQQDRERNGRRFLGKELYGAERKKRSNGRDAEKFENCSNEVELHLNLYVEESILQRHMPTYSLPQQKYRHAKAIDIWHVLNVVRGKSNSSSLNQQCHHSPHEVGGDDGGAPGDAVVAVHQHGATPAALETSSVLQSSPRKVSDISIDSNSFTHHSSINIIFIFLLDNLPNTDNVFSLLTVSNGGPLRVIWQL